MQLTSSNGNSVAIRLDGYEFPGIAGSGARDYDANWLIVVGDVMHDGRAWSFRDPCLLTWDVRELASWLRSVANGSRSPEPVDPDGDLGGLLVFTEPHLAFSLHARTRDMVTLRVYLSLEALPSDAEPEIWEYFVELTLSHAEIASVVTEWESELQLFPVRG